MMPSRSLVGFVVLADLVLEIGSIKLGHGDVDVILRCSMIDVLLLKTVWRFVRSDLQQEVKILWLSRQNSFPE
jgi:hypothetical protein